LPLPLLLLLILEFFPRLLPRLLFESLLFFPLLFLFFLSFLFDLPLLEFDDDDELLLLDDELLLEEDESTIPDSYDRSRFPFLSLTSFSFSFIGFGILTPFLLSFSVSPFFFALNDATESLSKLLLFLLLLLRLSELDRRLLIFLLGHKGPLLFFCGF
jgi:hypothetical protein